MGISPRIPHIYSHGDSAKARADGALSRSHELDEPGMADGDLLRRPAGAAEKGWRYTLTSGKRAEAKRLPGNCHRSKQGAVGIGFSVSHSISGVPSVPEGSSVTCERAVAAAMYAEVP